MTTTINAEVFFRNVKSKFPDGTLSQANVDGINALLDAGHAEKLSLDHMAYVLANVHRETGGYMFPVKETVFAHHKNKNPSDAVVKARLDAAFKAGKLKGVKTPYWQNGRFGRGQIQISVGNYEKLTPYVGVDLAKYPERAMELAVSARIAVIGMKKGLFTGKALNDFVFPGAVSNPIPSNPRRIVNGNDGSDKEVAQHFWDYRKALQAAAWQVERTLPPVPTPSPIPVLPAVAAPPKPPVAVTSPKRGWFMQLLINLGWIKENT